MAKYNVRVVIEDAEFDTEVEVNTFEWEVTKEEAYDLLSYLEAANDKRIARKSRGEPIDD